MKTRDFFVLIVYEKKIKASCEISLLYNPLPSLIPILRLSTYITALYTCYKFSESLKAKYNLNTSNINILEQNYAIIKNIMVNLISTY